MGSRMEEAHPVKERSRMEKPETEGGEKQSWSAADIQNFTEAVGDTNSIHRGRAGNRTGTFDAGNDAFGM